MSEELFSVHQFFSDDTNECVRQRVNAEDAVWTAHDFAHSVGAQVGTTVKVRICDSGDYIVFEWIRGRGVVYPPPPGKPS